MGRFGTNPAPNLTSSAPGGRAGSTSPRVRMALAAAALAGAAVGCGAPGEETTTVPSSAVAVAAAVSTTTPTTAAAPTTTVPPATVAAAAPPSTTVPTTAAPTTAVAITTTVPAPTATVPPSTTAAPPEGTVIVLEVTDGQLAGGARREAARLGEEVTLRVSGDSADHVHIHGYDLFLHLTEGAGELVFTADIPGVFEIELEEAGVTLVQLEVS